jgi:thiosulfate dehydrogenase
MGSRAIKGYKSMPAKGGNSSLTDKQVRLAVVYMINSVMRNASKEKKSSNTKSSPLRSKNIARRAELRDETHYHSPPTDDKIPNDKYGDDVRLGQKIFTGTHKYARRYVGNELSCSNCHLDAGRRPHSAPLWAAYGMYPSYKAKNDRNNTIEERIQQCFRFSMNGISPTQDAPEVRALVSYIHFLSRGVPIGVEMPGRGYPLISKTGHDPNPSRGAEVYGEKCASCHGEKGEGIKNSKGGGYQFPPLWGFDSYNKGAGMANDEMLAGFIKANMPLGQGWSLSDQEALDVAVFINLQIRPWDPRKGFIKGMFD